MKIAFFITSTGWGGLEMNTLNLARLLRVKGYSITLISQESSPIYTKGKDIFESNELISIKRKYFDFKAAKKLSRSLREAGIDIIIVFDNKDLDVVAWARKFYHKELKVIYLQQMQIGINKKDFIHTFRFRAIDFWISPLNYLKDEIAEKINYPAEKVKIIPLVTDVFRFTEKKYTRQQALQSLNIKPRAPLVGIIGRISHKKGQLFLVESLIRLKQKGIDIELLIFGSATVNDETAQIYYNNLIETVKTNNLENIVHFVEYKEDVSLFYNAVDIFALASHSETFGMVTIEAMLSELPIIATQSGGTSEILEFGKLGCLYEFENHDDFCKKLEWQLNNKEESLEIAAIAKQTAIEKYSNNIQIEGVDKLIRELAKR